MATRLFNESERRRLERFPEEVITEDLIACFTLTTSDLERVRDHRGEANRLGFALQLGTMRYLGFVPDELWELPAAVVAFLAGQLGLTPEVLADYGSRGQTRSGHFREALDHLGWRPPEAVDWDRFENWLLERAMEHDKPTLLFQMACDWLRSERFARPGVARLERLVGSARARAHRETYRRLGPLLNPARRAELDGLLEVDEAVGGTRLSWLRREVRTNSPPAIVETLSRLQFLRELEVNLWDLSAMNPNRLKFLAQIGRRATNQALQRLVEERRYPILVAFLRNSLELLTDFCIDLVDRCLAHTDSSAKKALEEFRRRIAPALDEKVRLCEAMGQVVLDPTVPDQDVRTVIFERVGGESALTSAVEECPKLVRPRDDNHLDFLENRYSYIRQFSARWIQAVEFRSHRRHDPLLEGVRLLCDLEQQRRRKLPGDAPLGFVPKAWQPYVLGEAGEINRHYYEMCLLFALRTALRSGDVWLKDSRRYADPETYLIPRELWPSLRSEFCLLTGISADPEEHLRRKQEQLEELLGQFDQGLPQDDRLSINDGRLVLSPLEADEIPESLARLRQLIEERLPRVELTDLLIEVDRWTGFSRNFEHAAGSEPRTPELQTHLFAAILAQACNIGLEKMAEIADLSFRRLSWVNIWYLREETLRRALTGLVNFQYRHPFSHHFGGGMLSSSDGQRFPVPVKSTTAAALPRYFGYGRGLTHYTWTSDQFSLYGTRVIVSTKRDSTYALDEVLDNETELPLLEHTTDTSGESLMVHAFFDLVAMVFSPRLRDPADQVLYRPDRTRTYRHIEPLLGKCIRSRPIINHWDDILRTAASLKMGWVTASLLVSRLQATPRKSALALAIQEYGKFPRTGSLVRWFMSEEQRRRIQAQLNKGEAIHDLRRVLLFAHQGKIRHWRYEEQLNQASCLNLVTNAVIIWNTVYIAAIVDQLKREGCTVRDEDLARLSPARSAHINPYGKYRFELEGGPLEGRLRPLRGLRAPLD